MAAARLVALAMAAALCVRRREHAVFAGALLWVTLLDIARGWLRTRYPLAQIVAEAPFAGDKRAAWLVDTWLYLSGVALIPALAIWYFARRSVDVVLVGWVAACVTVSRVGLLGASVRRDLLACELIALAAATVAVALGFARRARVGITHACVAVVVAVEFATLLGGAWPRGLFARYYLNVVMYVVLYLALIAVQGVAVWLDVTMSRSRYGRSSGH